MPRVAQGGEFFVVGGPVQSDRPCYVERTADGELLSGIAEQRFCYVLGPRATGKSSLIGRAIRRLRNEGQLAALVDLAQIATRGEAMDAGRWYYSIAYRIVRDLRLKVDLQSWWQSKSGLLGNQRLVEFFWEIVLANTLAPVTIFIDEAERALELHFAGELFSAIRSCYLQRVTEPDHARLNFVVAGVATPAQLCPNASMSPFVDGLAIRLADFSLTESYALGAGFGTDATASRALIERIHDWTNGQPYLTQKIARGVARRGGNAADVDRVVQEQFLATSAAQEEPLLGEIRDALATKSPQTRHALARLVKLARGMEVREDARAPRDLLELTGLVTSGADRRLRFRNQIFARVFGADWARDEQPIPWRIPAAAVVGVTLLAMIAYWYTQVLPRPYVTTLSVVTQDYAVAQEAYRRLHRLPGFGGTADGLLAAVMERRSERATSIGEAQAADAVIRGALGMEERANRAMARYWLRQADAAKSRNDRDAALLFTVESARADPEVATAAAAELIGSDYGSLERTFRLPQSPLGWDVDWERNEIVVVDQGHRLERFPLVASEAVPPRDGDAPTLDRLTALQHVPVSRQLFVEADRVAGPFNLLLNVQHARASDLLITLTAPSGAQATLAVPQPRADQHELIFSARGNTPLAALAAEQALGTWQLTVVDRRSDEAGLLMSWGLQFPADQTPWLDEPEQGVPLPDPFRSEQVDITLSPGAQFAVAYSSRQAGGGLAVWNLRRGELINDLRAQHAPEHVVMSPAAERVLAVSGNEVDIWDIGREAPIREIRTDTGYALPPAVSGDGRFVALAETVADRPPRFTMLRIDTGQRVASFEGVAGARDAVLDGDGTSLYVLDSARRVFVYDAHTGALLAQLRHQEGIERVIPPAHDGPLVTVDVRGDVHGWRLDRSDDAISVASKWIIGVTPDAASVSLSAGTATLAFAMGDGLVAFHDALGTRQPQYLRVGNSATAMTRLAPDSDRLVTVDGALFRVWKVAASQPLTAVDTDLATVALDAQGEVAALGYRGGHVRVTRVGEQDATPRRTESVDYIGHRGAVTSVAINAARNVVASGGADGVVRIWNMTTVAPSGQFLRHPAGPVEALALCADGECVVSSAGFSARVWATGSGELQREIPVDGTATAVAVSADQSLVAVGDTAGDVFFGTPRGSETLRVVRAEARIATLAVAPDATRIVGGDVAGNVLLWDASGRGERIARYALPQPVAWASFGATPDSIFVRSGAWVHELALGPDGLGIVGSRLLPIYLGPAPAGAVLADGTTVRWHAGAAAGVPAHLDTSFGAGPDQTAADAELLARDWPAILGQTVDRSTGTVRSR